MTLASETKNKTPDRAGASNQYSSRNSTSDALPPTLLRLPDLDPVDAQQDEYAPEDGGVANNADENGVVENEVALETDTMATEPVRSVVKDPAPTASAKPQAPASPTHSATGPGNGPNALSEPLPSFGALPRAASTPPVFEESFVEVSAADESPATIEFSTDAKSNAHEERESQESSLLETMASRKALLVVLLLIAGLAVFMPRGGEGEIEDMSSLVAESDVAPSEQDFFSSVASSDATPESLFHSEIDGEAGAHNHASAGSPTATSHIGSPLANSHMIQQPSSDEFGMPVQPPHDHAHASTVSVSQPNAPPFPGYANQTQPGFDDPSSHHHVGMPNQHGIPNQNGAEMPPVAFDSASQPSGHRTTSTPEFDPSQLDAVSARLAAAANEEIRRMDAARAAAQTPQAYSQTGPVGTNAMPTDSFAMAPSMAPSTVSVEPVSAPRTEILQSRTPQAITNWKKYLPPVGSESLVEPTAATQGVDVNVSVGPRTTGLPDEPDFGFALPGETASGASGQDARSSSATGAAESMTTPEARVAMPTGGYPGASGIR
ncbi:hypothetical protein [Rhodopirellula sp. SWK7]|uniref:hypothetical protein n=1 Tax=Rhodopirellula sp. SWK7 TaxID=595460 RepID=UPI0002BEA92C|nr:hypothetical protein [Rhodopirellula sp. SWK7]EMI46741.1 hypothetical protein RRSWK_00397 [Rhodopirellula sp. SWK7]